MLAILDQQVERLDRLVHEVLNLARLESGKLLFQPEPLSVLPVVRQVVNQMRARESDRPIQMPTKPGLPLVFADHDRVVEVLANLIDNADKYSPQDKPIVLEVRADQSEVTVTVRDFGPGIPESERERIFEKFHRTDGGDSQAAYGYGLGLYICRRFVDILGGRIWVENLSDGGCAFSFTLPVWQGSQDEAQSSHH